ncbi:hypothetical protein CA235_17585 [Sphingomonas sp. ABOLF]|uniref:hypothetical protein n=1 Tax=Sphingomonas sp. ABOLF TaxID=1985879 RepID=UPI000F7E9773|nr:hypothetical protein [Sphingomonas sp. ABOLF]RSV12286.1 hypothetical protein CA235_17585 [Sphingomonas sp. ABOLF]
MRKLFAAIGAAREWLTLLVVGAVAAWIYVQFAETRAERDALVQWAEVTCAGAGAPFEGSAEDRVDSSGKAVKVTFERGQRCRTAVTTAVAFKAKSDQDTAQLLADAMRSRETKAAADSALARTAAEAARDAALRMENADAQASATNRVDRDWFAALNDLAGLHAARR